MADPRKQDPNVPLKDIADGEVERETGGGMKFGAAWVWILVALFFAALIWFSVSGWGGNKNQTHRTAELNLPSQISHLNPTT